MKYAQALLVHSTSSTITVTTVWQGPDSYRLVQAAGKETATGTDHTNDPVNMPSQYATLLLGQSTVQDDSASIFSSSQGVSFRVR